MILLESDLKIINRNKIDIPVLKEKIETLFLCENLNSRCRKPKFTDSRKMLTYILRKYYYFSLEKIGEILNRDHSTVFYYQNSFEDILATEPKIKKMYDNFINSNFGERND
ncbi:MAG: hypothetical protein RLY43_1447 [Bacteroidota bacterium]|jgi:chromosomal replication initiation ATPase DnaA